MNDGDLKGWLILLVIVGIAGLLKYRPRWRGSGWHFGTSRWATEADLRRAGMLRNAGGLPIGRTRRGKLIWLNDYRMLAIFAPTGAGKQVSFLTCWLLTYRRGSVVVNDPKGELYKLTHTHRRAFSRVIRLDPFGVCGPGSDAWNPLDLLGQGREIVDQIRPLAEAMVIRSPEGDKDPHWNDQAAHVITALLTLVMLRLPPEQRNLSSLRELIASPKTPTEAPAALNAEGDLFARLGGVLAQLEDKERSGVLSTVHRHTTWADSPAIMSVTDHSTVNMRELLTGNVTLYLILPPAQLEAQARWLRLIIASIIRLIGQEGMQGGKECLMLLDEAGTCLGHMPAIEQGLTLLRSYGLRMALFFQSLAQLNAVFRNNQAILLDNTDAQIHFGTNSLETATRVSQQLGPETITVSSGTEGGGSNWGTSGEYGQQRSSQYSRSYGFTLSEKERPLLNPSEVLQLDARYAVMFIRGIPPLLCKRLFWYADGYFRSGGSPGLIGWLLAAAAVAALVWTFIS